jgi:hypothetical protein
MNNSASARPSVSPRSTHRSALFAWGFCALICVWSLVNVAAALTSPAASPGQLRVAGTLAWGFLPVVFAALAALIIARRPRNRIGWILLTPAIAFAIDAPVDTYISQFSAAPPASAGILLMLWYQSWAWLLLILPVALIMLLFPTGDPPSRRWRWVEVLALAVLGFVIVLSTFGVYLQKSDASWSLPNPIGFIPNDPQSLQLIIPPAVACLAVVVVSSAAALLVRYRRAASTERLQIKWLLFAAALFAVLYVPTVLASGNQAGWSIGGLGDLVLALTLMLFPVAVAIAILRYRLWEIDLIINRTLVYLPLTAIIAGIFSAASSLLQKAFVAATGSDSLVATVIATVIVVASFNPIKDVVQKTVDRGFKETPDPARRLKPFQELLRNRVWQLDLNHTTKRFLEEAVAAFDAEGGAAYRVANGSLQQVHTAGKWNGEEKIGVRVDCGGSDIVHIALGQRAGKREYSEADRGTLERAAAGVSSAIEEDRGCAPAGELAVPNGSLGAI